MAETAVFHILSNFAPFLQQEANLLTGVRDEIQYIRDGFERMTAFLRDADAMEENDPELKFRMGQASSRSCVRHWRCSRVVHASPWTSSWRWISWFSS
ncbi:hypothetical protein CsSME_00018289 [Camellia sinensis var. sinensis]